MIWRLARDPSRMLAAAALLLWGLALALPVVRTSARPDCTNTTNMMGYLVLLIGWLGPLQLQVSWYANPLIIVAVVRRLMFRRGGWWGVCALVVAIPSLLWAETTADTVAYNCRHLAGFYLWIGSSCLLALADLLDKSARFETGAGVVAGP